MKMRYNYSIIAEIESAELFGDDNINWKFCMANAPFQHEGICEFMFSAEKYYFTNISRIMKEFGCTKEFIDAYKQARDSGAHWVLFYV